MSLVDIFKNLTPYAVKAPIELGNILNAVSNVDNAKSDKARKEAYQKLTQIQPVMMNEAQAADIFANPLKSALKTGLSAGSFMLPGVGATSGLTGTLAKGGLSGAMGGYAESQPGQEGIGTLKGAGLGLAASGAVYGAGSLLSKLGTKAGQKAIQKTGELTEGIIKDQAVRNIGYTSQQVKNLGGWDNAKKTAVTFYNKAAEMGMDTSERYARSSTAQNLLNNATNDVTSFITNHPNTSVNISGVKSAIQNSPVLQIMGATESNTAKAINKLIASTGDSVDLATANALKGYLDEAAGGFAKGIQGEQAATSNAVIKKAREIIRTAMSDSLQGNEKNLFNKLLSDESDLISVSNAISGTTAKVAPIKMPLGMSISGTGATKLTDKLANVAAGNPGSINNAPIQTGLSNILGKASDIANATSPYAGSVANVIANNQGQQFNQASIDNLSGFSIDPTTGYLTTPSQLSSSVTSSGTDFASALAQAQQLLPSGTASEILSYAKEIMDSSGSGTATATGKVGAITDAINRAQAALDAGANTGLASGLRAEVGNVLGTNTDADTAYQSAVSSINTTIGTLLTGTAQTESEMRKLKNMLIGANDSKKAVEQKLAQIRSYIAAYGTGQ